MLAHLLKCSIKYLSLFAILIVICPLFWAITGCTESRKPAILSPDRLSSRQADDVLTVRNLTDNVLLALSLRDYRTLRGFLLPDDDRTGRYVAEIFLGNAIGTTVIEKWNAQFITLRFSEDRQITWTAIPVSYRRRPGGPLETATFRFKFLRCSSKYQWCLLLP
ncbi:MAG: hypothetical protein JW709_02875 [Sedimentisphaerales bacterium]|nr:hypothetical protein [Sedimentisphaerales bacterium]